MKFTEISDEEFETFTRSLEQISFLQSMPMVRSQRGRGMDVRLVAVKVGEKIIGASSIVISKRRLGYTIAECLTGPLLDYNDHKLVKFFTDSASQYLKQLGVDELIISPYLIYKQLDENADPVPNGIDNSNLVDYLTGIGYHHQGFKLNMRNVNWMFVKDLSHIASQQELESSLNYRTKKAVRKSASNGIYVKQVNENELEQFHTIVQRASETKNFSNRDLDYYRITLKEAGEEHAKIMMAYINLDDFRRKAQLDIDRESKNHDKLMEQLEKSPSKSIRSKIKVSEELISSYKASLKEADKFPEKGEIALAGIYFFCYGTEVVRVLGASDERYTYFNGMTAVYWNMLVYALDNGYKSYNFYGTYGYKDTSSPGHPIYLYKKGFGGTVVNLIGEFSLPIKPLSAGIHRTIKKLRTKL